MDVRCAHQQLTYRTVVSYGYRTVPYVNSAWSCWSLFGFLHVSTSRAQVRPALLIISLPQGIFIVSIPAEENAGYSIVLN